MKARFDFEPGAGMLYGSKLLLMIGSLEKKDIWVLTVAACSPVLFEDLRERFVELIEETVRTAGIGSFQEFLGAIGGFIWCDAVLGAELRSLQRRIGLK